MVARWLLVLIVLGVAGAAWAQLPAEVDAELGDELPRIDPLEPDEALAAFDVAEGYRVELVAAEPLVTDPVAMAFDEDGRLLVVEMRGYSESRGEGMGRVRVLSDTDGDGRMDESSILADGLRWPTAIFPWDGGVFVGAAPDILYLKDTTGDGKADHRERVFTGMAPDDISQLNVQTLVNSLRWGLDNRIHGTPTRSTRIYPVGEEEKAIVMRGREFNFDPHTRRLGSTTGGNQWGASFDNWGRLFTSINHDHNQMVAFENRYIARNPHLRAPSPLQTVGAGGSSAELYRISPPEPWRVVRTRLRTTGQLRGPVERGGQLHGYVSAGSAATVYRGDAYGEEMRNAAVFAAPDNNLVHRERLEPDGVLLRGVRIDEQTEWLRTKDNWFRPVWLEHGPDGALYVADMYREVIEHPWSLPDAIKRHLDLNSGRDRGRIYRIVPEGFEHRPAPRLSEATTAELVALLEHRNAWHRLTASRLLYERQDETAAAALRQLLRESDEPLGRLHAMYALDGLGGLEADHVLAGLEDRHPGVRENALRLAEPRLEDSPSLREAVLAMVDDADMRVRYQLPFTLGEMGGDARLDAIATILKRDAGDYWMRLAAMSSIHGSQGELLTRLAEDADFAGSGAGRAVLEELARQAGAVGGEQQLAQVARAAMQLGDDQQRTRDAVLRGFTSEVGADRARELGAEHAGLVPAIERMFDGAMATAKDADAPVAARVEAIRTLEFLPLDRTMPTLKALLRPNQPTEVQQEALATLVTHDDARLAELLIERWRALGPSLRPRAMQTLLSRPGHREALVTAMEEGRFSPAEINLNHAIQLRNDADASLAKRAATVLADEADPTGRRELVAEYTAEMAGEPGDVEAGRAVFTAACATCHAVRGEGHDLGPSLLAFITRGREALTAAVLDPNAEVDPQYTTFMVETEDGSTYMGVIVAESANTVTLSPGGGVVQPIARDDIRTMQALDQSLMPEGLEAAIDPKAMADLAAFLEAAQ